MKAEKPQRRVRRGDGIADGSPGVQQAIPASGDEAIGKASMVMEEVVRRENLLSAYQRVKGNQGAPGVDGMTVEALGPYLVAHWESIREELLSGGYRPSPVRLVEIPKPSGGTRRLGIPTVLDRLIQQAVLQVLQAYFDAAFSDESYGFRPSRSAHQAVRRAQAHVRAGHRWVVDMDLEQFFDRVNHDILMSLLARRIEDRRLLRLIRHYLQAGLLDDGVVTPRIQGTPQGGPLSPLLSNVLLHELDRELERRGHRFVRYADDCNVYVQSHRAGVRVLCSLRHFLWKRLRLVVNESKSAVARPWKRTFLGYTMLPQRTAKLRVSPESVRRLKKKLRMLLRRGRGRSLYGTIRDLEPLTRGWVGYFREAEARACFEELDEWIRRKLRCIVWRQWKRPRTRLRELRKRGLDEERARRSAYNGRGPWWNACSSHLHKALPSKLFHKLGLLNLANEHRRLQCLS